METVTLDGLDRALLHALHVDGRAPFRRIAEVLGVSDQTVARRYQRLRAAGVVRVVGRTDARSLGQVDWLTRIRCVPDAAAPLAEALARRPDTSWVSLLSGGEIVCNARGRLRPEREELLLGALPRSPRVLSVSAHYLLRTYVGGQVAWSGRTSALTEGQIGRLRAAATAGAGAAETGGPAVPDGLDRSLLAALALDGRAPLAALAAGAGSPETTVRRRLAALVDGGLLFFDVDVDPRPLGFEVEAFCWLTVAPGRLAAVGRAMAEHPEVGFVAATTGPSNLVAGLVCRDTGAFYDYLTQGLGELEEVVAVETAPLLRSVKRAGMMIPSSNNP
ncbi:Lrp/AsnC family transcriptional regulator [Kitasatospora purpeofusca]|uniref:Lrp/AsnC family transcriptional regulator n=1 Tax=Kitasatospora purpeofusca TaxID=67352 RepID=UPI00224FEB17|nr:AsnC family transcriptional regulator [Kitasatospora purpeofusca]MCX4754382.1 AsnC family transcriptional regulator [Kitasatospora purpeofusca]WSR33807.1 AsnC family transcriptional regulator [Kitasatospora purpeofusca]WSR42022.1 AsnC family transcriptional regulator [Kitasatospora purpeofusca]